MKKFEMQQPVKSKVRQFCEHQDGVVKITTFDTSGRKITVRHDFRNPESLLGTTHIQRRPPLKPMP